MIATRALYLGRRIGGQRICGGGLSQNRGGVRRGFRPRACQEDPSMIEARAKGNGEVLAVELDKDVKHIKERA